VPITQIVVRILQMQKRNEMHVFACKIAKALFNMTTDFPLTETNQIFGREPYLLVSKWLVFLLLHAVLWYEVTCYEQISLLL